MKQKLMNSIGGCLLLAFLLLACPIRGQAADAITVTDNDNGVEVKYTLTAMESDSAEQEYSAEVSFADADAQPTELNVKSVVEQGGTSYKVKEITSIAKNSKDSLAKISIAEGITAMYYSALTPFDKNSIDVQFPSTLEKITGTDGFVRWSNWPDEVTVPAWLSKMKADNGVVYAGKVAVYVPQAGSESEKVSEITFKDGCTQIAHKALFGNKDVTKVNIPASVKMIRGAAFDGCTNLSQVNFAANAQLEDLDWRAFYDCTALASIRIPDSVTRIGTETFSGCTSLATMDISAQSKLTTIEYGAFGYYPYKVDIAAMQTGYAQLYLGPYSNYGLRENAGIPIKQVYLPAVVVYSVEGKDAAGLFAGSKTLEEVTIGSSGDTKASIPFEMFAGCTSLKSVNLGGNVDKIDTGAFAECEKLTSINLDGVEKIQTYAFVKSGLTEVTIPSSVKSIESMAFGMCTSLETMNMKSSLPEQDESPYGGTKMMQILGLLFFRNGWNQQYDGCIKCNDDFKKVYPKMTALKTLKIFKDSDGKNVIDGRQQFVGHIGSLEKVVLPDGMTEIPKETFHFCWSLNTVDIPESIEKIGDRAFQYDIGLDIDFSKLTNLKEIGSSAFMLEYTSYVSDDGAIKEIILPDSVETINSCAFWGQVNVTKVVIPESVNKIGDSAFHKLSSLEELRIYSKSNIVVEYWGTYDLRDSSGFNDVFWNGSSPAAMKKIVLGKHFLEDGKIGNSLFHKSQLEEIDIQCDNIENIGRAMFMRCKNLKSLTIPKTVKTIEQGALYETTALKEITIPANVKTMDVEVFRKSGVEKVWILNKDLVIKEPTKDDVSEEESATKTKVSLDTDETVDDYIAIPKNIAIYGYAGSTAEAYAEAHGNKFIAVNKVTFDSVGGSKVDYKEVATGEKVPVPEPPTKEHYVFKGWYTDKDYKTPFDFDKEIKTGDITLYAKWEKEKHTVSFDTNGGSTVDAQQIAYEEKATKPAAPTKEHYVFVGWYKEAECETEYTFEEKVEANITLYAKWKKEIYTVSFDSAGGSAVADQQVEYEKNATRPESPTKEHYVFAGWYKEPKCETEYTFEEKVESNITLYAKWKKEIYTVSFDSAGGSAVDAQKVTYEDKAAKPEAPTKEHYVFAGWYKEAECETEYTFEEKVEANITLYAKWEKGVYTVSFDSIGGSEVTDQKITYEEKVTKPADPTKEHYVFVGWYKEPECETEYTFEEKVESNITLYAKWDKAVYKVSFDSAGGSAVDAQKVTYEDKAAKPEAPTKEHYVFAGWYKEAECETEYTFEEKVESNITLYAKWEKEVYKVSFDSAGGSEVADQQVTYENKATKPTDPTRENYIFEGWYTDKECTTAFDFDNNLIEEDITLYAKWTKKKIPTTADKPQTSPVQPVKKNTVISNGKNTYKVTKVTKQKTGTVEFTGIVKGKKVSVITIPNAITINGKKFKVTSIATGAFANNKAIKKVIIGNNVKVIKKRAFYNAKNLRKIVIGANVTTIQKQAFGKLPKLEKIIVKSKKLKKVHKKAFSPLKRELVIRIYKKPVTTKNNKKKATNKNTAIINRKITIKVPKSKIVKYTKLFKSCKR